MRLGLCCLFKEESISFRTTTARSLSTARRDAQLMKLSGICRHNAASLLAALDACRRLGIGSFRVMSPLFPRMTHPGVGYRLEELPEADDILSLLGKCRTVAATHDIRLSFHPDQFVVISSPNPAVVANSIGELVYQGWLSDLVGADVINIHAGGVYGDREAALERLAARFPLLPENVRSRLSLENDDICYTVADLLPLCRRLGVPLVYDVHHHRCNPDGLTVEQATELAAETWLTAGREPYCHISSPRNGWGGGDPRPHADFIDPADFPECWQGRAMTLDVEAKAKELAVVRLKEYLCANRNNESGRKSL